ncbi:MAG: hypothetical protein OQK42_03755 [Sedimenticola sp.]|nr:hypothetical protein [Sedimenticola sp.]MCW8921436.1 hypothetical protein [Sedimenticola sp.]MCW8948029.1 hypothetical protein [Sedimenticola sp.]MCW8950911.1 hypothetical protein [Sedimenticola sp.]MCW8976980.1 hypothetical protein [Sedimenticola sp.]
MSEISQPTPIKPTWPVKRDDPKRKPPESEQQKKKKKVKSPRPVIDGDDKHPRIDDYA